MDDTDEEKRARALALGREMERNGRGRDGPIRGAMGLVGDRWSALVLLVLQTGEWRHADLRRMLGEISDEGAISQRVLTQKLRALEREGFVARSVSDDVPPKVSYRLSPLGDAFLLQVREMLDWLSDHRDQILAARESFDAAED